MGDSDEPRYRPLREIARGGMGRVVEAVDSALGRTVAVKENITDHPEARRRFAREVAITARLEHPSIVPLYDAGVGKDGAPFYVMRKVSGVPLDQCIRAATTLDQRLELLPHVLAAADAVAHAHGRRVIHRDLKPANVIVGELGETVVIDWGLAKALGDEDAVGSDVVPGDSLQTRAGSVFGTPGFMAPEQAAGGELDPRSDVYALGATLYMVLSGKHPREARVALTGVPRDLATIVDKAMAPARGDRYLDAGGLSEDLRRFLAGQLVAAHRYPASARVARWVRRHRIAVAVATAALAALATVGALALRRIVREHAATEAARAGEHARAEDLIVAQASFFLDENPTLAAASLQRLPPDSPRWAGLDALVDDLRARGVAYGLPSTGHTVQLDLAPDDDRVLVSSPGLVLLHDLRTHATRTIATGDVWSGQWAGTRVLVHRPDVDELVDPSTLAHVVAPWPATSAVATAADGTVVIVDGSAPRLLVGDASGAPPAPLAMPEPIERVTLSRSGYWLVASGAARAYVFRAARATPRAFRLAITVAAPHATSAAFDARELRMVVVGGEHGAVELDLVTGGADIWRPWPKAPAGIASYARRTARILALDGRIHELADGAAPVRGLAPVVEVDDRVVTLVAPRRIAIASPFETIEIAAPEDVETVAVRPGGCCLVAAGPARVLVWRLDEILPRRTELTRDGELRFARDGSVRLVDSDAPTECRGDITALVPLDAGTVIAGTRTGEIVRIALARCDSEELARLPAAVEAIDARAGWVVARASDGTLWRRGPRGAEQQHISGGGAIAIDGDGVAFVAVGHELHVWDAAPPRRFATIALPIRQIVAVTSRAIGVRASEALYRIDRELRAATVVVPRVRLLGNAVGGRVVATAGSALVIADVDAGTTVRLVEGLTLDPSGVALDPSGAVVLALRSGHEPVLEQWQLRTAPARAWIAGATNAGVPATARSPIPWR